MRKIILATLLLALPLVCFGQDAVTKATLKQEEQPLQLTIKSDKQVYEVGEEIKIKAIFHNLSNKEIIMFWKNDEPQVVSDKFNVFSIVVNHSVGSSEATFIKSRDSFIKEIKVSHPFPVGLIHLTLEYAGYKGPLGFAVGELQVLWLEPLISNTITIEVVEKKSGITKEEALKIAEKVCKEEGWRWYDILILDKDDHYFIKTNKMERGGNAEIMINKKRGDVISKIYHNR